MNYYYM